MVGKQPPLAMRHVSPSKSPFGGRNSVAACSELSELQGSLLSRLSQWSSLNGKAAVLLRPVYIKSCVYCHREPVMLPSQPQPAARPADPMQRGPVGTRVLAALPGALGRVSFGLMRRRRMVFLAAPSTAPSSEMPRESRVCSLGCAVPSRRWMPAVGSSLPCAGCHCWPGAPPVPWAPHHCLDSLTGRILLPLGKRGGAAYYANSQPAGPSRVVFQVV